MENKKLPIRIMGVDIRGLEEELKRNGLIIRRPKQEPRGLVSRGYEDIIISFAVSFGATTLFQIIYDWMKRNKYNEHPRITNFNQPFTVIINVNDDLEHFNSKMRRILEANNPKMSKINLREDHIDLEINKSSRHSRITGDFAEDLVLYWLSKHGFECANIDHTGIDIIARNPHTNDVMGISVKSRSRNKEAEGTYVSIPNDNFEKVEKACYAFRCKPYFAIVVDERSKIVVFLLSMEELLKIHPPKNKVSSWTMGKGSLEGYYSNPNIRIFEFEYKTIRWWE